MKLCLAATSSVSEPARPMVSESPYLLESFYYFKDFQIPLIKSADLFLLDSGAFTFMSGNGSIDWNDYLNRYADFINKHDVQHFFELDIDVIVGYDEVKRMRTELEAMTGKRCIPVWHKSRGLDEYMKLVDEYDYIAIGGFAIKVLQKSDYPYIKRMVQYAYDRKVKVHGLGFTPKDVIEYKFYSCDSTTWHGVTRFGRVQAFNGKHMVEMTPKNAGCNKAKINEIETFVLREWIKYQKYLHRK